MPSRKSLQLADLEATHCGTAAFTVPKHKSIQMPTQAQTNLKEKVRQLPHQPGVYLMKDRFGRVLYVGKAKDLKKRVATYFQPARKNAIQQPKIRTMVGLVHALETVTVRSEAEALLLEGRLIKEHRPRYNTDFVDDKRFLLVRVDMESELPRFRLTRNRREDASRYFGPFAHSGLLRQTLSQLRRKYGVLLRDGISTRLPDGRWKLYDDARAEIYGHTNVVTAAEYLQRVEAACDFLEGKSRQWLEELEAEMRKAAESRQFERAAELRDISIALRRTIEKKRKFTRTPEIESRKEARSTLRRLQAVLELSGLPDHLECFDISHISGTFAVASMVHFSEGRPDKARYRRFRIRSFVGNDDFRAMEEVVGRRYRRLHEEGRPFPDLIVIDGGRGQVGAALKAFHAHGLEPPPLVGLAKKEETVVFPDERGTLNLPGNDPALHLLQRLRDEAHRFANAFNAELRGKKIRETILLDFEGLGPVRRQALMNHFGSLERLRSASPDELRKVEGIGPKLAESLTEFLATRMPKRAKATSEALTQTPPKPEEKTQREPRRS